MWGGASAKYLTAPPRLLYYLVTYATYAHHIPKDVEGWRSAATHDVHHILQGFMESMALAIKDGSALKRRDDGMYIDHFRIPPWLYEKKWVALVGNKVVAAGESVQEVKHKAEAACHTNYMFHLVPPSSVLLAP
jgi:hypothetical protein